MIRERVRRNHQQGAGALEGDRDRRVAAHALAPDGSRFMTYDRTLIVIRERSFLDLLDLALLVVRDRPVALSV